MDREKIKRQAYHDQGIVVISVNHPDLTWDQREYLKQIANKIFGPPPANVQAA